MGPADFILLGIVAAVVVAAFVIRSIRRKKGKSSCCDGNCEHCRSVKKTHQ